MNPLNRFSRALVLAIVVLLRVAPPGASAADTIAAQPLPPSHAFATIDLADWHLTGPSATGATAAVSDVANTPAGFAQALHVEISHRAANSYDVQYVLPIKDGLAKGDVVWLALWARMLHTEDESGQGVLDLVFEQSAEPFAKLTSRRISVGAEWQQLAVPARAGADFPAGTLHLTLRLGGAAQTLEIGGFQCLQIDHAETLKLSDLPQTRITYSGREADAAWRKDADARIDQFRKSALTVHVIDAAGRPLPGATVDVQMVRHAFPFGCVYSAPAIAGPDAGSPANQQYARRFAELFNVGVDENGMKWPAWNKPDGPAIAIKAADWMAAHHIRVRGHNLLWPSWQHTPGDLALLENDRVALAQRIDEHVRDEVGQLRGKIAEWDVINEPYANRSVFKVLGEDAMAHVFDVAHQADPSPTLYLNETSVPTNPPGDVHYDALFEQVQSLQKAGAPIGGVGMQAHFGSNLTAINDLQRIYDRFATLNLPVEITELDISVGDDQLQADYLRDFLTESFSHPNIGGVMMWGFVENHHWRPDAALWRSDWKIKPAGEAWMDLVKNKWWTTATLKTAGNGDCSIRGFLGDYALTITAGGKTEKLDTALTKDGKAVTVQLK